MNIKVDGNNLIPQNLAKNELKKAKANDNQGVQQFSQKTSAASLSYGLAQVSFGAVQKVSDKPAEAQNGVKTINLFYFSDTHGELTGLPKLASAKEACSEFCGGNLTFLGAGDLIAGSQQPVINATVDVVNALGMEATAMGNHERSRSDEKLNALNENLAPEMLAINASKSEQADCQLATSKVLKQGDQEFIVVGATPLTPIQKAEDLATAIDDEVSKIKADRREQGLSENLPVVFLSHVGLAGDKTIAEKSKSVNVILGGHTHLLENTKITSESGNEVLVLQGGQNNAHAQVVKMNIAEDGTVTSDAKILDLKDDVDGICKQVGAFYGSEVSENVLSAAKAGENVAAKAVTDNVGERNDIAYVPEGYGYTKDPTISDSDRRYSNPVANIMADAMLAQTAHLGTQVSFFNSPSVKDTTIEEQKTLTNYDIMSRMMPFGGEVAVADLPIDKLYEMIEKAAQPVGTRDDSQLCQVGGMVYSVDAKKANARHTANIGVLQAEDDLKKAKANGGDIAKAEANLAQAKENYESLPKCVEKIMILNADGSELKINPKAIARGDYEGQTIKCATSDFFAHINGIESSEYNFQKPGIELTKILEKGMEAVKEENDGVVGVDHNEIRISVKDEEGLVNGYPIPTGINSKYWY